MALYQLVSSFSVTRFSEVLKTCLIIVELTIKVEGQV